MHTRHILFLSAIGAALLLGQAFVMNFVQAFPTLVKTENDAVRDGAKVTVWYQITLRDNPTTTYSDTEQFIQGEHNIPPALEQQMAGMQPGEAKTFPLSAEEGFGPYDETKIQTIPTVVLPLDAREGDIVDDAGRTARIVRIFPETTVVDLNHPLAGKPLIIMLQIVTIENPDKDKVDKNTVSGNGDHPGIVIVNPGNSFVPLSRDLQHFST
jgi:FKBP-type peptidyl-prolyl cis-trans isomerase 2